MVRCSLSQLPCRCIFRVFLSVVDLRVARSRTCCRSRRRARPPPPPRRTRAPAAQDSYINKKLSLITKAKIRYEGVLTDIDLNNQTLTLKNVRPASGRARAVRQNSAAARARC